MSRNREKMQRPRKLPTWIAVILVVLLSAVALALSYVALTTVGSGNEEGLPVKSEAAASAEALTPAPSETVEAQPETDKNQIAASTSHRLLTVVNNTAMRAESGTCENPGMVEISLNDGQSWSASESLAEVGATQILRLLPTEPSLIQVVALDRNCEPQVYRTENIGATWDGPLSVGGTWYFDPSNSKQVGAPGGTQSLPCEGIQLAPVGDRAAVRCIDGSIVTTTDRGFTWSEAAGISEVVTMNYSPDSYVLVQGRDQSCEGLRLKNLDDNSSTVLDTCFETDLSADELTAENIAIAQSGTSTLLWVGDDLVTSADGGRTWL